MDTVELLLHPVRMRIVHAMHDGRTRTTTELCALLPDVSKATVYRHVGLLADGGLLAVEGEQRVRGSVERRYQLHRDRAVIDAGTARVAVAGGLPAGLRRGDGHLACRVQRLP
nr:hypothetical protein StreXyl84_00060 [Streptomyces sp. Xyl84]